MKRKGIILAGGSGTRLYPMTSVVSKQLMPVYDKPMIYYPLATLMQAGIRDIAVISTPADLGLFKRLLGSGAQWGLSIEYFEQARPEGLAQSFLIVEDFLEGMPCALVLGDNIFYGHDIDLIYRDAAVQMHGATIFLSRVADPERYGVAEFDDFGHIRQIIEKPKHPKSNYAVVGLYFYDHHVSEFARKLKPSARGELEITDLNRIYLEMGLLSFKKMRPGHAWFDTGTCLSLLEASHFVSTLQNRQGIKIACLEEIAWRHQWISTNQLLDQANKFIKNDYGQYLVNLVKESELQAALCDKSLVSLV